MLGGLTRVGLGLVGLLGQCGLLLLEGLLALDEFLEALLQFGGLDRNLFARGLQGRRGVSEVCLSLGHRCFAEFDLGRIDGARESGGRQCLN